jgi:hypothetical protein
MTCQQTIIPRFVPDVCDALATQPDLTISADTTLDTSDAANCNGGLIAQATGPEICVVHYSTVTVAATAKLQASGTRALALVADQSLTVDGLVEAGGSNGPGGGRVVSGGSATATDGAGGAGFATAGGPGGSDAADGGAANGGAAQPAPSDELVGGATGGGPLGGSGGGAVTLISCQGTVAVAGVLDAGGQGGGAEASTGGSGGGAGGYFALQGRMISMTGQAFANGGGGGGGFGTDKVKGFAGPRGPQSTTCALGGDGTVKGGAGGCIGAAPGSGGRGGTVVLSETISSGGGGGSTGFLATFTPLGVTPVMTPVAASPAFQPNMSLKTR